MKYLLLIYFSLYTSTLLLAQESVIKNIGDFSILKVYDLINVELIKSDKNLAEIKGDNKDNIEIVNKNGVLKIRLKIEKSFDGKTTNVKLFYNSIFLNTKSAINSSSKPNPHSKLSGGLLTKLLAIL